MESETEVNVEQVMRRIGAQVRRRQEESAWVLPPRRTLPAPDFDALEACAARLRQSRDQVGGMPPKPPTVRGHIGALLVRIVRRMLFFHTYQVRQFGDQVRESFEAHTGVLKEAYRGPALAIHELRADLNAFERRPEAEEVAVTEALAGRVQELEEKIRALEAALALEQQRVRALEQRLGCG